MKAVSTAGLMRASRRDRRPLVVTVTVIALIVLAQLFAWWFGLDHEYKPVTVEDPSVAEARKRVYHLLDPPKQPLPQGIDTGDDPSGHARAARLREIDSRFRQGAAMLHAGEYAHAMTALHRVLELEPRIPEAHVNMGFALLGLERPTEALAFFQGAAELQPMQTNAYYGMALAYEALGDLRMAVETMETFLHLEKESSYFTRRGGAAVWEWRAELGSVGEEAMVNPHDGAGLVDGAAPEAAVPGAEALGGQATPRAGPIAEAPGVTEQNTSASGASAREAPARP